MKTKLFIFLFLASTLLPQLFSGQLAAQNILARYNRGALLEPSGKIINGAGQDLAAYNKYWNIMHPLDKPLIYMTYVNLKNVTSDWADGLKTDLMSHAGKFQIPQIGLSMTPEATPTGHFEQDVAAGLLDKQIAMFIDGLESLAFPAYVRIGYEFNGVDWNGYQPDTYKQAFIRITNMIRARNLEVATVWNLAMDGVPNFTDYYPGDAYVDWWSLNLFSASHFTNITAQQFLDSASVHKKPVLIGETTPRSVGVLNGQTSWNQWFAPFFTFIHAHREVKAFSYINWNWAEYPEWSTWGDARLEQNTVVSSAFDGEMDSVEYLHASTESAFRKTLGISDNTAPAIPGSISVTSLGYPLQLKWNPVTDPSGLSHYIIYKRGVLSDYSIAFPYSDRNIIAGDTITYAVSAMDRAGNESQKTAKLKVTIPSSLSKIINGEFDNGTRNWILSTYATGAVATMKIDSSSLISGRKSCEVDISQVTGTDWHIDLWQWLSIHNGCKYRITFKAKAESNKTITLAIQQAASPYVMYFSKSHTITSTVQSFTDTVTLRANDQTKFEFFLGQTTVPVWIDSISVVETSKIQTGISDQSWVKSDDFSLLHNYPNPFHLSTTISYNVTQSGLVTLKVFDPMGREIKTLVNRQMAAGSYSIEWNASGLFPGTYICKLMNGNRSVVRKMILLK